VNSLKGMNSDMDMRIKLLQEKPFFLATRSHLKEIETEQMYLQIALDFMEDIQKKLRKYARAKTSS